MPSTMNDRAKEIHRDLWSKVDGEDDELHIHEVESSIKDVAGRHRTTVERYLNELVDMGLVEKHGDLFTVSEPSGRTATYNAEGSSTTKHVSAPESIVEEADRMGVNFSAAFVDALLDSIRSKEEYVSSALDGEFSEEECEYLFRLVKSGLYEVSTGDDVEQKIQHSRENIYKDVFDVDGDLSIEQLEHIDELRNEAFVLGEEIL